VKIKQNSVYFDYFLTHYRPAMPFGNRKKYFREYFFSFVFSQFKKYYTSGNLKINDLVIFQS